MNTLENKEKKIIKSLFVTIITIIIIVGFQFCPTHGGVTDLNVFIAIFVGLLFIFAIINSIITLILVIFSLVKRRSKQTIIICVTCMIITIAMLIGLIYSLTR